MDEQYYNAEHFVRNKALDVDREVDFYLKSGGNEYKCEVKLMGKGCVAPSYQLSAISL